MCGAILQHKDTLPFPLPHGSSGNTNSNEQSTSSNAVCLSLPLCVLVQKVSRHDVIRTSTDGAACNFKSKGNSTRGGGGWSEWCGRPQAALSKERKNVPQREY